MKTLLTFFLAASLPLAAAGLDGAPRLPHKLVTDWAQLPAGWNFGECSGVDVDGFGNVWVFNRGKHQVIQFDKSGKMISAWQDVPVTSAHGIGIDPDNNVWLIDVKGHTVMKFNRAGRVQMVITNAGKAPGNNDTPYAFNEPTGIAFKPDGGFYVSDGYQNSRVVEYTKAGVYVRHWGSKGTADGQFNLVHDVAYTPDGKVYVADRTNERIQIFDASGKFLAKWDGLGAPWGLAYSNSEKAIYMADGKNNRIVKLDTAGKVLGVLGEFGKAPGALDFAHHIAVDADGSIYVVEIKNWRVQKFAK